MSERSLASLRRDYRKLQLAVPVKRRRICWGSADYECELGPLEEDGPFEGEHSGGCGWGRRTYLGVGVGYPPAGKVLYIPVPTQAGKCAVCSGVLTLQRFGPMPVMKEPVGWASLLIIPNRRIARRLAQESRFEPQLMESREFLDE